MIKSELAIWVMYRISFISMTKKKWIANGILTTIPTWCLLLMKKEKKLFKRIPFVHKITLKITLKQKRSKLIFVIFCGKIFFFILVRINFKHEKRFSFWLVFIFFLWEYSNFLIFKTLSYTQNIKEEQLYVTKMASFLLHLWRHNVLWWTFTPKKWMVFWWCLTLIAN